MNENDENNAARLLHAKAEDLAARLIELLSGGSREYPLIKALAEEYCAIHYAADIMDGESETHLTTYVAIDRKLSIVMAQMSPGLTDAG